MKKQLFAFLFLCIFALGANEKSFSQITLLQNYSNYYSAPIGVFQGINFREGGFSSLYPIPNTNGKEFWTISDRGVNIDATSANPDPCHPTYDKIFPFPNYAPKIHRIRINGDSVQILQTITMKRPDGTNATGLINPDGFGSLPVEQASTDTVMNCANFNSKIASKDVWGIDSEGITVDSDGNFWVCEEGGPTVWKMNQNGVVINRYTPFANLPGAQSQDLLLDTVFKYRKNNRGFENITRTPNGKIYALIQSPLLFPDKNTGEASRIHRMIEINPSTNATREFVYLNDGIIGSGSNKIRLQDWKLGDMAAINDSTFLVIEAASRGTTDIKKIYLININQATPIVSNYYGSNTLEALVDSAGMAAYNLKAVKKTLFMDLKANSWPAELDKSEGLAIINDSTIAVCNDNDFGQSSPLANGIATPNNNLSHVLLYRLSGANKIPNLYDNNNYFASVSTGAATMVTVCSALCSGSISSIGASAITQRGIVWSKNHYPTVQLSNKTVENAGLGDFTNNLSGLEPNTTYYYRAYAINASGVSYGEEKSFVSSTLQPGLNVVALMEGYWDGAKQKSAPVGLELRKGDTLATSILAYKFASYISPKGEINVNLSGVDSNSYWIVVRASGFLPIASPVKINMTSSSTIVYDFTDSQIKTVSPIMTILSKSKYVMRFGDSNGDSRIVSDDINLIKSENGKDFRSLVPAE